MTGEIANAIIRECQAIPDFQVGTVMLKTDFVMKGIGSYDMPLLLIEMIESNESMPLIGGIIQKAWDIALNSYNYEPDPLGDDPTDYSTSLLNVIDTVYVHFSNGRTYGWLTTGMTTILNDYGFRFTLTGITAADAMEGDGLVMGYKVGFSSVSFDTRTTNTVQSTATVTSVAQVGNPPY